MAATIDYDKYLDIAGQMARAMGTVLDAHDLEVWEMTLIVGMAAYSVMHASIPWPPKEDANGPQ